jgi:hypothetical protein
VLDLLEAAPCTSVEASAATGLGVKHCCAYLRELWKLGIATRTPHPKPGAPGRIAWRYELAKAQHAPQPVGDSGQNAPTTAHR